MWAKCMSFQSKHMPPAIMPGLYAGILYNAFVRALISQISSFTAFFWKIYPI